MNDIIELRSFDMAMNPDNTVHGYAAVFNSRSADLGGFVEEIAPEAMNENLFQDVVALFNHNKDNILARYRRGRENNTLSLSIDQRGLHFSFVLPDTELGREIREAIARGDVDSCSFGFVVAKDDWKKEKETGTIVRRITEIRKLLDISVVVSPAYADTSVVLKRGLDEIEKEACEKAQEIEEREEEQTQEQAEKPEQEKPDLTAYFTEIKNKYGIA